MNREEYRIVSGIVQNSGEVAAAIREIHGIQNPAVAASCREHLLALANRATEAAELLQQYAKDATGQHGFKPGEVVYLVDPSSYKSPVAAEILDVASLHQHQYWNERVDEYVIEAERQGLVPVLINTARALDGTYHRERLALVPAEHLRHVKEDS